MTATAYQALQRTGSAVTAPAANRLHLSTHRQVPRPLRLSLSLRSFGVIPRAMFKIGFFFLVMLSTACADDSALVALGRSLTPLIQQHFPHAEINRTETSYTAKHGTMEFTVHGSSKTGEVSAQTRKEEGPNYKGFILEIALCDGRYEGAAVVPQHLKHPYWTAFIDAPAVTGQSKHLWIRFSYGGRLSSEFQKAIFAALPKSMP